MFCFAVFAIDNSGVLTTREELDRETVPSYSLIITARDGGAGGRQGMANVTITINDENDNSPVFTGGAVVGSGIVQISEVSHCVLMMLSDSINTCS